MAKTDEKELYRDAKTGQFVTQKYAERHKSTTVKEHRPVGKRR